MASAPALDGVRFGERADALGPLRFCPIFGPGEAHLEEGAVVAFDGLIGGQST